MAKHTAGNGNPFWRVAFGLSGLTVAITILLKGTDVALLNPRGSVAQQEHNLLLVTVAILLVIAIPALTTFYFVAWKYREGSKHAEYNAHSKHGKKLDLAVWGIPTAFMLILATIMWPATHRLEPRKALASDVKPLKVQVIAMRWKWLFIYPEQNIATVNYLQVPTNTPIEFDLSADEAPMSSFWIPHLGGQLYAMTGHSNRLNLMADTPGDYHGRSAEINGAGFAGMTFMTRASSPTDFDLWVQNIKNTQGMLDSSEYAKLLEPSENNPQAFYGQAQSGLYDKLLIKYGGSHGQHTVTE